MTARGDLKEIRDALNMRALELCRELLPRGRDHGGLYESTNPRVAGDDRKMPALKVRVRGGDTGAWTDYRNGRDGHAGDLIGLIAYLHGSDTKGALAWARDFLGLKSMTREERAVMRFAAEAKAKKQAADGTRRRLEKFERARKLFELGQAMAPLLPEPGSCLHTRSAAELHARAYFGARRVPLADVANLNRETFRFSAASEWWRGAEYRQEGQRRVKVKDGPRFPAVHAAMRQWNGFVSACHLTFLDPLKPAKAPVEPAKLMYGEATGAVIEISTGEAGTPFWADDTGLVGPVILAEGIETGLALAIAVPEARVWACGSISGFAHAPVQLPIVGEIYLARDNNAGNAQAQKQIDAALDALERHKKPLSVMASHVGDDFNDLATGEGE